MNTNKLLTHVGQIAMSVAILATVLALAVHMRQNHHQHQADEQPNDVTVIAPPLPEPEPERPSLSEAEAKLIGGAKILMESHFKDHSVAFANMRAFVERQTVCGVISLQNRSGGDFTVHRFIARPSKAMFMRENKAFSPDFSPFWAEHCTTKKQSV